MGKEWVRNASALGEKVRPPYWDLPHLAEKFPPVLAVRDVDKDPGICGHPGQMVTGCTRVNYIQ